MKVIGILLIIVGILGIIMGGMMFGDIGIAGRGSSRIAFWFWVPFRK